MGPKSRLLHTLTAGSDVDLVPTQGLNGGEEGIRTLDTVSGILP